MLPAEPQRLRENPRVMGNHRRRSVDGTPVLVISLGTTNTVGRHGRCFDESNRMRRTLP
jgi:hypothetical protein